MATATKRLPEAADEITLVSALVKNRYEDAR
jgi:hypothetical protein